MAGPVPRLYCVSQHMSKRSTACIVGAATRRNPNSQRRARCSTRCRRPLFRSFRRHESPERYAQRSCRSRAIGVEPVWNRSAKTEREMLDSVASASTVQSRPGTLCRASVHASACLHGVVVKSVSIRTARASSCSQRANACTGPAVKPIGSDSTRQNVLDTASPCGHGATSRPCSSSVPT